MADEACMWQGACMVGGGMHVWQGACMARGHVWTGGMHVAGGMCGRGHVWQGACVAGGIHGGDMHGRGCAWMERGCA